MTVFLFYIVLEYWVMQSSTTTSLLLWLLLQSKVTPKTEYRKNKMTLDEIL